MKKHKEYALISALCKECGKEFVITPEEQRHFGAMGYVLPKRCIECRKARKIAKRAAEAEEKAKQAAIAEMEAQKKREADEQKLAALLARLPYKQTETAKLQSDSSTLLILGNGFDMMYGAKSSYWNFQETLGKHNDVRENLETYLKVSPNVVWYNVYCEKATSG